MLETLPEITNRVLTTLSIIAKAAEGMQGTDDRSAKKPRVLLFAHEEVGIGLLEKMTGKSFAEAKAEDESFGLGYTEDMSIDIKAAKDGNPPRIRINYRDESKEFELDTKNRQLVDAETE